MSKKKTEKSQETKPKTDRIFVEGTIKSLTDSLITDVTSGNKGLDLSSEDVEFLEKKLYKSYKSLASTLVDTKSDATSLIRNFALIDIDRIFRNYYQDLRTIPKDMTRLAHVLSVIMEDYNNNTMTGITTEPDLAREIKRLHSCVNLFYTKYKLDRSKLRTCIDCGEEFFSVGPGVRRCTTCVKKGLPSDLDEDYELWGELPN